LGGSTEIGAVTQKKFQHPLPEADSGDHKKTQRIPKQMAFER
jgi:hypothetical protein